MSLPKQLSPVYTFTLPSTKKIVKFRPWRVGEEKALLLAQQSEQIETMVNTLKQIIEACTFNELDVNKLATFDFEYCFAQIRAKSVEEIVQLILKCDLCNNSELDTKDEKAKVIYQLDLTTLAVKFNENHINNIKLYNNVGVVLKYPTFEMVKKYEKRSLDDINTLLDLLIDCIDYIYDEDQIYHAGDQTREELIEFVNNLTHDQFQAMEQFFATMPVLEHTMEFVCPVCQQENSRTIRGLESFF